MNKSLFYILEITVWVLILAGLFALVSFNIMERSTKIHMQVPFEDTDGLVVGSPVKYMGVQVGYVNKLKIQKDETIVSFIITKKGIKIPKGTVASVEFSGLAASKSLQLNPSKDPANKDKDITPIKPYRIQNYIDNQKNIANNIIKMSSNFNDVLKKNNIAKIKGLLKSRDMITGVDRSLDTVLDLEDKALAGINKRLEKSKKNENQ